MSCTSIEDLRAYIFSTISDVNLLEKSPNKTNHKSTHTKTFLQVLIAISLKWMHPEFYAQEE